MKVKSSKRKTHSKKGVSDKQVLLTEASIKQLSLIDALLETSCLPQKEYEHLYNRFKMFISEGEADEFIEYLQSKQRDNISSGFNYSKTDIVNKLKRQ